MGKIGTLERNGMLLEKKQYEKQQNDNVLTDRTEDVDQKEMMSAFEWCG